MVDSCCAPGCTNHRGQHNGKSFYRIPKDPARREKWIAVINRARSAVNNNKPWNPTLNGFRLCSDHFISGVKSDNPLSPDYIPSVFKNVPSSVKKQGKLLMAQFISRQAAKKRRPLQETEAPVGPNTAPGSSSDSDYTDSETDCSSLDDDDDDDEDEYEDEVRPSTCDDDNCITHIDSLKQEAHQLRAENQLLKKNMSKTELNECALQNSDKQVLMLTGLPTCSILMAHFNVISPHLKMKSALTSFQQFVMTLMKLRMNLSFEFLAFYFEVDSATVSKLFHHCVSVMYCRLVPSLIVWPEREILRKALPNAFRNKRFEKTVCVIDCFEIFIEKPSAQCKSEYNSHHTMKYLIAISPQASICFISNGWGGRTSDKFITENSNFLSHLCPGDLVLADRGFNVGQSVQPFHADLKIRAFTRGKNQLDPVGLESTRSLASLGTHVERVIGAVRQKYTFLQSTVPATFTDIDIENDVMYLDKIVKICCALTNICESVLIQ